jgi:high affinity sulfate transporter 1
MRNVPLLTWLHGYDRSNLRYDLIAGLTVWALVVPQSIAYAQIAGLPPQAGVFCSFAAPLGYALFGTSRQLIVSPTSATAAISASLVGPLAASNLERFSSLAALLSILSGIVFVLLGIWKLGFVSQFIATSVQTGFLFGLGLTIIVGQAADLLGTSKEDGPFYKQFWHLLTHLDEANGWTAAIGITGLVLTLAARRFAPGIPTALILVAAAIAIVALFSLDDHGVHIVGSVDRAVPLPALPTEIKFSDLAALLPGTLAIAVIGYSESVSVAEGFADEHKYEIKPNRELTALGVSAVASGFFQGFIAGGGASQSAANDRAGARTQMSGVVLALLAALTSIALMPLFKDLPIAILAAIVISAVTGFLNVPALRRLRQLRGEAFVFGMIALIGVLFLGILPGLLITAGLSVLLIVGRQSRPSMSVLGRLPGADEYVSIANHPEAEAPPAMLLFRIDAPLLFINASWMRDGLREQLAKAPNPPSIVVLDLEFSLDLDIKSIDTLANLHDYLRDRGSALWLAGLHAQVELMLERAIESDSLAPLPRYRSVADAVAAAKSPSTPGIPSGAGHTPTK